MVSITFINKFNDFSFNKANFISAAYLELRIEFKENNSYIQ